MDIYGSAIVKIGEKPNMWPRLTDAVFKKQDGSTVTGQMITFKGYTSPDRSRPHAYRPPGNESEPIRVVMRVTPTFKRLFASLYGGRSLQAWGTIDCHPNTTEVDGKIVTYKNMVIYADRLGLRDNDVASEGKSLVSNIKKAELFPKISNRILAGEITDEETFLNMVNDEWLRWAEPHYLPMQTNETTQNHSSSDQNQSSSEEVLDQPPL